MESVRSKSAENVIFSERFIDYTVGSKKYKTPRPKGETDSLKEVKKNDIYYTFKVESKPIFNTCCSSSFWYFFSQYQLS